MKFPEILHFQLMIFVKIDQLLSDANAHVTVQFVPSDSELFSTSAVSALWWCIERCWQDSVYIQALCHRFWKLTLQVRSHTGKINKW